MRIPRMLPAVTGKQCEMSSPLVNYSYNAIAPRSSHSPMAARWSDLPDELLDVVLLHLPCLADRVHFAAVCRAWRSAEQQSPPPPQLPWLLLPPAADSPPFFIVLGGATHRLFLPEYARRARWCGSFPGGWLICALGHWRGYALLNLLSGARFRLPDRLGFGYPDMHHRECTMVIRAAALSAAPLSSGCCFAAIVSSASNLAFWRPGMAWWFGRMADAPEDLIYHKSKLLEGFHVLTTFEGVSVYTPHCIGGDGGGGRVPWKYSIASRADARLDPTPPRRYLVESRGKLLMVLRYSAPRGGAGRRTWRFRVYEMVIGEHVPHGGGHPASWVEVESLDGHALFVGQGCSRAFEASQFGALEEDCIYFMDDNFDTALTGDNRYSCIDMGMYSMKHRSFVSCFGEGTWLGLFPPIWFFPSN